MQLERKIHIGMSERAARGVLYDNMLKVLQEFRYDDCFERLENATKQEIEMYKEFCETIKNDQPIRPSGGNDDGRSVSRGIRALAGV